MNNITKKILSAAVIVLVIWGISSLGGENQDDKEIIIGGLFGQTGFVSFAGETSKNAFIMAVEDSSLDINPVIEDFQSDIAHTVTAAKKLIEVDKVDVIIGPEWAEFSEVALSVAEPKKVLVISPWMSNEFDWVKSKYYFSGFASERGQIRAALGHMVENGVKNIALITTNNAWAEGVSSVIRDEVRKNYPNLNISFESSSPEGLADYRTEFAKMRSSNVEIDAVYGVIAGGAKPGAFSRQYKELELNAPLYMPLGSVTSVQPEDRASSMNGVLFPTSVEYNRVSEFNEKYKTRFGVLPAAVSGATTYDMTTLVLNAIQEGAQDTNDVIKYLKRLKGYRGYSNTITFNSDGHVESEEVEMNRVIGLGFEVVK